MTDCSQPRDLPPGCGRGILFWKHNKGVHHVDPPEKVLGD